MTERKQNVPASSKSAGQPRLDQRQADSKEKTAKKPRDDDMPGADGLLSARADEDTYD